MALSYHVLEDIGVAHAGDPLMTRNLGRRASFHSERRRDDPSRF